MMKGIVLFLAASVLWLSSCAQGETNEVQNQADGANLVRVSKTEFKKVLTANPDAVLIDVRTPREYNGGKIGHAQNINFNDASFKEDMNKLDKDTLTLIYCQSGGRSGKALDQMREMGFTNVRELEGGYGNW
ncbi:MAG: rhodanese-related sulfurtransferase [Flavobacteriaceae bacterium]|jgi:rhodanese-related sulfurtransferase